MNLEDRLVKCFASVFPGTSREAVLAASPENLASWDSLTNFSLIVVVEEEFGIQISPDDLDHLRSFESVRSYLLSRVPQ